jgi:hypothetical protein
VTNQDTASYHRNPRILDEYKEPGWSNKSTIKTIDSLVAGMLAFPTTPHQNKRRVDKNMELRSEYSLVLKKDSPARNRKSWHFDPPPGTSILIDLLARKPRSGYEYL